MGVPNEGHGVVKWTSFSHVLDTQLGLVISGDFRICVQGMEEVHHCYLNKSKILRKKKLPQGVGLTTSHWKSLNELKNRMET